jgi:hypothetical protein
MQWADTPVVGRPGFVQSRLYDPRARALAEVELHEEADYGGPVYYASIAGGRQYILCQTIEEAKAVAMVHVRFNQAEVTN